MKVIERLTAAEIQLRSTSDQRCSMKPRSLTRILRVLRHASYLCVLPLPKSPLPPSSAPLIAILFCGCQHTGICCGEYFFPAQSRHPSTPLLLTIEFP
jgi:hypothetical protein